MKWCSLRLLAFFAAIFVFSPSFVFSDAAVVVLAMGKVEVYRNEKWVVIAKGDFIDEGEILSTGFNSEVIVRYQESMLRLGSLSRVVLERLVSSEVADDISIYIETGAVASSVKHREKKRISYTVRNSVAAAHVRGTEFEMLGNGELLCFDGAVEVFPVFTINPGIDLGVEKPGEEIAALLYTEKEEKYSTEKEAAKALKRDMRKRRRELEKQRRAERKRRGKKTPPEEDSGMAAGLNSTETENGGIYPSQVNGLPDLDTRLGRGGVIVKAGRKAVFSNRTGSPTCLPGDEVNALEPYRKLLQTVMRKSDVRNLNAVKIETIESDK